MCYIYFCKIQSKASYDNIISNKVENMNDTELQDTNQTPIMEI